MRKAITIIMFLSAFTMYCQDEIKTVKNTIQIKNDQDGDANVNADNNTYQVEDELIKNISKVKLGAVTDVSDQFVMLNIKGSKVFDLFATGSPFNFNDFRNKKGSVVQTILTHIDVIIHHKEINEINLFVRRSFSQHLHSWMSDSASRL